MDSIIKIAGIGMILLIMSTGRAPAAENSKIIRIMNYNIKGLPFPWLKHKKRFGNMVREFHKLDNRGRGADVLTLQEAFTRHSKIIQKELRYPFHKKGPRGKWFRTNSGLETLSRFEIIEENEIVYKKCASYDCLSRKGVQHVRIRVPGVPVDIDIYNTHMQAGPTGDIITPRWYTTMIRELQALDYFQFIVATHGEGNIAIHTGDFNFKHSHGIYPVFRETLELEDAVYDCATKYVCEGADDPINNWQGLIDHQFYREPVDGSVSIRPVYFDQLLHDETNGKVMSDHDATMVYYKLEW